MICIKGFLTLTGIKMLTRNSFILIVILILWNQQTCQTCTSQQMLVYKKMDLSKNLLTPYIKSVPVKLKIQCFKLCRVDPVCKSVGIRTIQGLCYLYKNRVYAGLPRTVITDPIQYYWQLEDECPISNGYTEDPSSKVCYKHHTSLVTWFDAQTRCEEEGGHLFIADTHVKRNILEAYGAGGVAVGATDIGVGGVWRWFNGADINDWYPGQPDNYFQNENCLYFSHTWRINDNLCNNNGNFLCEIPTK